MCNKLYKFHFQIYFVKLSIYPQLHTNNIIHMIKTTDKISYLLQKHLLLQ